MRPEPGLARLMRIRVVPRVWKSLFVHSPRIRLGLSFGDLRRSRTSLRGLSPSEPAGVAADESPPPMRNKVRRTDQQPREAAQI